MAGPIEFKAVAPDCLPGCLQPFDLQNTLADFPLEFIVTGVFGFTTHLANPHRLQTIAAQFTERFITRLDEFRLRRALQRQVSISKPGKCPTLLETVFVECKTQGNTHG